MFYSHGGVRPWRLWNETLDVRDDGRCRDQLISLSIATLT